MYAELSAGSTLPARSGVSEITPVSRIAIVTSVPPVLIPQASGKPIFGPYHWCVA